MGPVHSHAATLIGKNFFHLFCFFFVILMFTLTCRSIKPRGYYMNNYRNNSSSKNNMISLFIIGGFVLLFVIIGTVYMGTHSGNSALESSGKKGF